MKLRDFFKGYLSFKFSSSVRKLEVSPLFDADYYTSTYDDAVPFRFGPEAHYLLYGWKEHRNPSAEFDTAFYLFNHPDVLKARINPLLHYLNYGAAEGRPISEPPISAPITPEMLEDTSVVDVLENLDDIVHAMPEPAPVVEIPDSVVVAEVATIHESGMFDETYYREKYPDVEGDPLRHYCKYGWREGKNPSDEFDTRHYLSAYEDIADAGLNPFWHFVVAGLGEGRLPVTPILLKYESDIEFGDIETDIQLLAFYASPDWSKLKKGQPEFKGHTQPVMPDQAFGYYVGDNLEVLGRQADVARQHGIRAFCFSVAPKTFDSSDVILPFDAFLANPDIDIGLCAEIDLYEGAPLSLIVERLEPLFLDSRALRVQGEPVVLVKVAQNPDASVESVVELRALLSESGISKVFIIAVLADNACETSGVLLSQEFDAVLERPSSQGTGETGYFVPVVKNGVQTVPYDIVATHGVRRTSRHEYRGLPFYHTVSVARDNTTQKSECPTVYTRFELAEYRRWLDAAFDNVRVAHRADRRFVFLSAWNDWNEGLFIEPEKQIGYARVNEVARALTQQSAGLATPKVTVIVPNYKHAPYLSRRLESIYGQTYKNIEVLLLDDCSPDDSRDILDAYQQRYPRITRTIYNDVNSGGAFRQWAKGIKAATGEIIWVAESDDYCEDQFLEKLVRCFDDEAVMLAYAKSVFVDKDEVPMGDEFSIYLSDLECASKWTASYVETAHNEVRSALGIKNTIPNASGVLFKRPIDLALLDDPSWLSMAVAGDWVFYLNIIRGGKVAFRHDAINYFRRYQGSTAQVTYKKAVFYREVGYASRTVAGLYDVPVSVLERCMQGYQDFYWKMVGGSEQEFSTWYDYPAVLAARNDRTPNILVSTMGFSPGGAEILPIRMANEFKRQGYSVILLSAKLNPREDGIRRMLRNDVPLVETSRIDETGALIRSFGIEALNSHQWHIQKYPLGVADVFSSLRSHVASLHGMIEHGEAFETTVEQLECADKHVSTWVYTADKNLVPFKEFGLFEQASKFVKIPNGLQAPDIKVVSRSQMGIPEDAFVLCCVSRAIVDKGWAETIDSVERAREISGKDIRLILVGNGPVYDDYCRSPIPDFVYLAGFSENAVGYYAAADVGIMLTKFKSESFPLTIIDCLFAGRPYIASDVGDIRNMLTKEGRVAGAVIPLVDWEVPIETVAALISDMASDKDHYAAVLSIVPELASRYKIDVVAQQYVSLFERDIAESRMPRGAVLAE